MPVVGQSGDLNGLRDLRRDSWFPRTGCSRGVGFWWVWRSMRPPFLRAGLPPCLSLVAGWRPSFVSWAPSAGADLRLFPSDAWFERRPRGGSAGPWAPSTWRPRSLGRADRFAWSPVAGPVACGILGWFGGCGLESPAHGVASLPRGRRPRVALQRVSRGALLRMIADVLLGSLARSRCSMRPWRFPARGVA